MRVGLGFDAHRLVPGRSLFLGGLPIPYERGLEGHSDGDALLHALCDALLGAIGSPDLGSIFPSTDERWRNAPSSVFVEETVRRVVAKGFHVEQVDLIVIAEAPRLSPHVPAMRARIAGLLGIPEESVGLKAKTTDGMGFTGRGEGLAAQAVVLVS